MAKKKYKPLGVRLKRLREEKEISLETLANQTGLRTDVLLEIEEESRIPPVAVLLRISRALGVDTGFFLKEEENAAEERRAEETRKRTENYSYRILTPNLRNTHLKAFHVSVEPRAMHKGVSYQHEGEEFVYVLQGQIEVSVGENVNHLMEGDSLHFNSSILHALRNPGDMPTELLVVLYTP